MKNRKIVIATHGSLADGFLSALGIIVGKEDVTTMCCYLSPDFNLDNEIRKIMKSFDSSQEDLWIFTDLFGGSVNNGFVKAMSQNKFNLVSNINLGFLVDFILTGNDVEAIKNKLSVNEFRVIYCNDYLKHDARIEQDI